jgi:hypothetical protein
MAKENGQEGVSVGEAKNLTPTIFGLMIAYVVPGVFAVITAALFSPPVAKLLLEFSQAESSTGLAILLLLTALLAGLQLNILTWVIYQEWILKKSALSSEDLAKLRTPAKAAQLHVLIDQVFRYHQFAGAQSFVIPVFAFGLFKSLPLCFDAVGIALIALFLVLEGLTVWSAIEGGRRYFNRCRTLANILETT